MGPAEFNNARAFEACPRWLQFTNIEQSCPTIALERVFLVAVIFAFTTSLAELIFAFPIESISKMGDILLQGLMGTLVLIGSINYIVSTVKVSNLIIDQVNGNNICFGNVVTTLHGEKMTAAVILNSLWMHHLFVILI